MGNTHVVIDGGTVSSTNYAAGLGGGNVYGGGLEGIVTGDTKVEIKGGTINGNAFAGGRGYSGRMISTTDEDITDRASRKAGGVSMAAARA